MRMELVVRFDYGSVVPWVSKQEDGRIQFIAGPDRLLLDTEVAIRGEGFRTLSDFMIGAGQEASFALNWSPSFRPAPPALSAAQTLQQVESSGRAGLRSAILANTGATARVRVRS